jgi:hypothetical protein
MLVVDSAESIRTGNGLMIREFMKDIQETAYGTYETPNAMPKWNRQIKAIDNYRNSLPLIPHRR